MSPFLTLVILIALLILAVRLGLWWVAGRNRLVDTDHSFCKRCEFDLFNRYPDLTACPECGAEITGPESVRWGRDPQAPIRKRLGMASTAFGLLVCGGMITTQYLNGRFVPYAPDFLLSWEVRNDTKRADKAMIHLHKRVQEDRLSERTVTRLVQEGLARQADLNRPWDLDWGTFIQLARRQGQVTDVDFDRYLQQAVDLSMSFEVKRFDADSIRVEYVQGPIRMGDRPAHTIQGVDDASLRFWEKCVEIRVGSQRIPGNTQGWISSPSATGRGGGTYDFPEPPDFSATPTLVMDMAVTWNTGTTSPGQELFKRRIELTDPNYVPPQP